MRVAEFGGNTLLLTGRRSEAWNCPDRTRLYVLGVTPTASPIFNGRIPPTPVPPR